MFQYVVQVVAFQLFFLMVYDFLLKKETFFNWNRAYLLITALLSFIIPFVKIDGFKNAVAPEYIVTLPEVFLGNLQTGGTNAAWQTPTFFAQNVLGTWEMIFLLGAAIALILFGLKLFKMIMLLTKNPRQKINNFNIINVLNSSTAFSFFKYIFLGALIQEDDKKTILKHEMVHVKQFHSLDLLLFEVLRILFWFNPLIYMYQNRLVELHEFIADAHVVNPDNKKAYYENLLSQVFETKKISFINPFFKQSLIKKRIVMLTKSKSKKAGLLKFILIIPMIIGMLMYASSTQNLSNAYVAITESNTPLIEKIAAVKSQIAIQGHVTDNEQHGLNLLLTVIKGEELSAKKKDAVKAFMTSSSKSKLEQKIAAVFEQIQMQGNINNDEEKALKHLLVLTSKKGLNDAFFLDILNEVEIPFGVIDQVPVFPGCEDLSTSEQKACFAKNISTHVGKHFNTKLAQELKLEGKLRINVLFRIDKSGHVTGVKARSSHPALEEEAVRVVNTLPQMTPGKHQNKTVIVPYSLPIIFQVDVAPKKEDTQKN